MPTLESDDDFFLQNPEMEHDDDLAEAFEQTVVINDLFSEVPNDLASTEDLHGEFEGDLRAGLMARIATGGAIKE